MSIGKEQVVRYLVLSAVAVGGAGLLSYFAQQVEMVKGVLDKFPSVVGISSAAILLGAVALGLYEKFKR